MAASPILTVVAVFHEMPREAARTLHTLSSSYQRDVAADDVEILAIDNGSVRERLSGEAVARHGPNMRLIAIEAGHPSPVAAINRGVTEARGEFVMILIDGARMLSPRLIAQTLRATRCFAHPFVYSLGMHLGPAIQNVSMTNGYGRDQEDRLLAALDWKRDGYALFAVSSVAASSKRGFLSALTESNCFTLRKTDYDDLGGYHPRFMSPGGGLANLDFFNRAMACDRLTPIMLLGEATFHQVHGGVATNVPLADHPWPQFEEEYRQIRGRPYAPVHRRPCFFGEVPAVCERLLCRDEINE